MICSFGKFKCGFNLSFASKESSDAAAKKTMHFYGKLCTLDEIACLLFAVQNEPPLATTVS